MPVAQIRANVIRTCRKYGFASSTPPMSSLRAVPEIKNIYGPLFSPCFFLFRPRRSCSWSSPKLLHVMAFVLAALRLKQVPTLTEQAKLLSITSPRKQWGALAKTKCVSVNPGLRVVGGRPPNYIRTCKRGRGEFRLRRSLFLIG